MRLCTELVSRLRKHCSCFRIELFPRSGTEKKDRVCKHLSVRFVSLSWYFANVTVFFTEVTLRLIFPFYKSVKVQECLNAAYPC